MRDGVEDVFAYVCAISSSISVDGKLYMDIPNIATKGVCPFCNPKSVYFNGNKAGTETSELPPQ